MYYYEVETGRGAALAATPLVSTFLTRVRAHEKPGEKHDTQCQPHESTHRHDVFLVGRALFLS